MTKKTFIIVLTVTIIWGASLIGASAYTKRSLQKDKNNAFNLANSTYLSFADGKADEVYNNSSEILKSKYTKSEFNSLVSPIKGNSDNVSNFLFYEGATDYLTQYTITDKTKNIGNLTIWIIKDSGKLKLSDIEFTK